MKILVTWIIVLMINILKFLEATTATEENQLMSITIYQGASASQCSVNALITAYNKFDVEVQIDNLENGILNCNLNSIQTSHVK